MLRAAFVILALLYLWFKFSFHELWKDEWQAWLMARDMDWGTLLASLYYEGHPALWYVYLKPWTYLAETAFFSEERILLAAHSAVALPAFYLLFFRFTMPWWLRVAFFSGYYLLFEYGMVGRGYILAVLLGFALAATLRDPARQKPWLPGLLFFLLCQTEVYGVLLGGGLIVFAFLAFDKPLRERWFQFSVAGMALGVAVFVLSVFPRAARDELSGAYLSAPFSWESIGKAIQGNLANTYWLGSVPDTNVFGVSALGLVLSALVLAALGWLFRKSKPALFSFLIYFDAVFLFSALIYSGGVRQWGVSIIFFIILLELWHARFRPVWRWDQWLVIGSVVAFQWYYAALALHKEYLYPFSNSRAAGAFIREKVPAEVPIVAINKFETAPVGAYAGRPLYALPEGEPFTYFKWVEKVYLPPEAELRLFAEFKGVGGLIILSPKPLDPQRYPNCREWKTFNGYSIKREDYYLYTLQR